MEGAPNLDILIHALTPPPGYERRVDAPLPPAGEVTLTLQMDSTSPSHRPLLQDLDRAPVNAAGTRPASAHSSRQLDRRFVSAAEQVGTLTEAVADQRAHPVSAVGRIAASFNGTIRYCTATVVAERVVLTAAHCVYAKSTNLVGSARFADWTVFQPQYIAGTAPGKWAGEAVYVQRGWTDPEDGTNVGAFDYAFVRLDAPIAALTGTMDMQARGPVDGTVTALGYPREPSGPYPFDGRFLYATTGHVVEDGMGLLKAANTLTEGSSGGPWLSNMDGTATMVGLNSMKPLRSNEATWSPVLGDAFLDLFARVLADMTGV